ncbi:DUF58 domain-containing protein [Alienimonas californiensis]|uniref:DUF58 domain-containing protein n=1 Tax=Alienimonas californiensis TaxID=2527989 RepID=A0A517PC89_9PLAN|nr:DUF58 domain-containing protein [Alienimonas californiensis]QDT16982.1 hypothetical protein CA12_30920 [Alienimonas californiensis]
MTEAPPAPAVSPHSPPPADFGRRGTFVLIRAGALLGSAAAAVLLATFWERLDRIDPAVPLLSAAAAGALSVWVLADLIARLDARLRPDRFGHPRPVRRRGWIGLGALLLAASLGRLTPWTGLYGFLPLAAAAVGVWCLTGAARRAWLARPGAARFRSREERTRLTLPGWIALGIAGVLLLGAFLGPSNMLLLVCCLVLGPIAADGWFAAGALRRCEVRRSAPAVAAAGEVALIELALNYRGRWLNARQVTANDRVRNRREDLTAAVVFARVPPRERQTGVYRFEPRTRGPHALGPVTLSTAFPMGLVRREIVARDEAEMLVLPPLGAMTHLWDRRGARADEPAHHARPRKGLFEDEFYQLREYRPGDGSRAIHWRSSAKAGELMVREYHESRDRDLVVLLDLHADGPPGLETENTEERAASLAATIVTEHLRRHGGATLSLRTAGAEQRIYVGRAGGDLTGPLTELALAEPGAAVDLAAAATAAAAAAGPAARRALITTRPPDDPAFAAAGLGSRRGPGGGWEIVSARLGQYDDLFVPPRFESTSPDGPTTDGAPR